MRRTGEGWGGQGTGGRGGEREEERRDGRLEEGDGRARRRRVGGVEKGAAVEEE